MNFGGIVFMVGRAARFALAVCAVYAAVRMLILKRSRAPICWRRELMRLLCMLYLAALCEIIALRGGPGTTRELRLIPLATTLATAEAGAWSFIYNFVGNLAWFVPLGMMLHRKRPLCALLTGAAVSASLEALQWILKTGISDVDDVIINALGALIGCLIFRIMREAKHR